MVVLERHQIVVAIDSRTTESREGQKDTVAQEGVEKVLRLNRTLAFFVTGHYQGSFQGTKVFDAYDMATSTFKSLAEEHHEGKLELFAPRFREVVIAEFRALQSNEIERLIRMARQEGRFDLFTVGFVGRADDGKLWLLDLIVQFEDGYKTLAVADDSLSITSKRGVRCFGITDVLKEAKPGSPVDSLRKLVDDKSVLSLTLAEGLLETGIRNLPVDLRLKVGYPLFLYRLDATGFNLVKIVEKGAAVRLEPTPAD